jgi:hypothetical protein
MRVAAKASVAINVLFFISKRHVTQSSPKKYVFLPKVRLIGADTMTGGYDMYIHSYQIHNVLNVYRQQLSRGTPRSASGSTDKNQDSGDRIDISGQGQRETLFEKISTEIVQRLTQFSPDTESKPGFSGQSADSQDSVQDKAKAYNRKNAVFSYNLIDNNNKKTTHNLSIRQLDNSNDSTEKVRSLIAAPSTTNSVSDTE